MIPIALLAAPLISPEVLLDGRVTFRVQAPKATEVKVWGDWIEKFNTVEHMERSDAGLWSVTIGPIPPNLYLYLLLVVGVAVPDPANPRVSIGRDGFDGNFVEVPGGELPIPTPRPVPRGTLRLHTYNSTTGLGRRGLTVYTPPENLEAS